MHLSQRLHLLDYFFSTVTWDASARFFMHSNREWLTRSRNRQLFDTTSKFILTLWIIALWRWSYCALQLHSLTPEGPGWFYFCNASGYRDKSCFVIRQPAFLGGRIHVGSSRKWLSSWSLSRVQSELAVNFAINFSGCSCRRISRTSQFIGVLNSWIFCRGCDSAYSIIVFHFCGDRRKRSCRACLTELILESVCARMHVTCDSLFWHLLRN